MVDERKINENVETKICKCCGRKLPLSEFGLIYGKYYTNACKDCKALSRDKSNYEKGCDSIFPMIRCILNTNTKKSSVIEF